MTNEKQSLQNNNNAVTGSAIKKRNHKFQLVNETMARAENEKVPVNSVPIDKTLANVGFQKPKRKVTQCFIHCSADSNSKNDDVSVMARWHLQRGFAEVGYHYFIKKDGTLQEGRNIEEIPAAQNEFKTINGIKIGGNTNTIAICLHGGGGNPPINDFTQEQYKTLKNLCKSINNAYNGKITFHGHCEVSSKACPVFDYKSVLELNTEGLLGI